MNDIKKLNYNDCIIFLKLFKFMNQYKYKQFFKILNNKYLSLYLSPPKQFSNFSWLSYLSNNKRTFTTKNWISYEGARKFAINTVKSWGIKNNLNLNNCMELWNKYKKNEIFPENIPKDPADHYKHIKYNNIWKENGYWNGFFGNPVKELMYIEEKLKLINNKKAIYSNKNIKQDQNDYLYPGIYLYIFPDDKKYVGQTKVNILYRLSQHIHDAINNNNHGCPLLDNKIRNLIKTVTNKIPDHFEEWEKIFFNKVEIKILEKIEQGNLNEIEFQKLLDTKEGYYIYKYKCYKNSLNYDGKLGLNCKPGVLTTEIHKRDINNCYDHNENLLKNGIESIKIKNKIVGYKARIRGKYEYSITMGNSYNYTLDKKLEIVNEFKKIKINSVELEKKVINEFKKKYNINNFPRNQKKSYNKIDHNNEQLPSYIFFDKINKKYKLHICRDGVSKQIDFYELVDLDLQLEKAKYFRNLYINLKLDDKSIMNMTYNDLKSHIKKIIYL